MGKKFIKTIGLCISCLTLTLLFNVLVQKNNLKILPSTQVNIGLSPNEDAPWG
ncbi:hypothetical protein KPL47_05970 [Clostridium estertheticum]|uniref:hypothetical protein n=1 Tax=Clostridium estertheticum TaxID=238834 RepID=UPI001C0CDE2C|nr:hypothetical protein [Clostridium estertheticum]MBU3175912.1 hypothetical protein [Clostridium estertheticum]